MDEEEYQIQIHHLKYKIAESQSIFNIALENDEPFYILRRLLRDIQFLENEIQTIIELHEIETLNKDPQL